MRKISYYTSRGQRYGKVPATSYREDGKVKKRNDGIYLGRVIDEEHHVIREFSDFCGVIGLCRSRHATMTEEFVTDYFEALG